MEWWFIRGDGTILGYEEDCFDWGSADWGFAFGSLCGFVEEANRVAREL